MVCMAVSKGMLEYYDEFKPIDRFSIILALVFLIILGGYILFGCYFVFCKSHHVANKH